MLFEFTALIFNIICYQCLLASSFVPGFVGWMPPCLESEDFIDTSRGARQPGKICSNTGSEDSEETDQEDGEPRLKKQERELNVRKIKIQVAFFVIKEFYKCFFFFICHEHCSAHSKIFTEESYAL